MRIESSMAFVFGVRMRAFVGSALLCPILLCQVSLGVTGSFRGRVIDGPEGKKASGWLYLESRNHMIRRVEISRAKVTYAESVPREQQAEPAHRALIQGAEVRLTAEQSSDGEWSASEIEILQVSPGPGNSGPKSPSGGARSVAMVQTHGFDYKNKPPFAEIQRLIR